MGSTFFRLVGKRAFQSTVTRSLPDDCADVVVLLHVIEHVPDPIGTLKEIHRVLKPGGRLIAETPRYDTLMFKLFGRRERSLSCNGHIYFFTTDTLRKTYDKAGFVLEKLEYVGRSLTLDRLVYNIGVMIKIPAIAGTLHSLSRALRFNKVSFTINVRDMQRVYIRKLAQTTYLDNDDGSTNLQNSQ
jgi:SAM-dependent methyltransferase